MLEKVAAIIAENLDVEKDAITMDTELIKDLNINSIDVVNLVCVLEEEFNIEIPDRQIGKFVLVRDVVDYLDRAVKKEALA